jgi:hypothetical protein
MLHLLVRDIYRDGAGVRPRIKAQDALSQFRMTPSRSDRTQKIACVSVGLDLKTSRHN